MVVESQVVEEGFTVAVKQTTRRILSKSCTGRILRQVSPWQGYQRVEAAFGNP